MALSPEAGTSVPKSLSRDRLRTLASQYGITSRGITSQACETPQPDARISASNFKPHLGTQTSQAEANGPTTSAFERTIEVFQLSACKVPTRPQCVETGHRGVR